MKAIILGILASFFFAVTFVLNRAMNLSGGSWIWSAVLRYGFMVPPLLVIVLLRGNLKKLLSDLIKRPRLWLGWSTVGFGLFYAPLCFAAAYGPAWLVASMWQITIIAGSLLSPLFLKIVPSDRGLQKVRAKVPLKGLRISLIILAGVAVIQLQQTQQLTIRQVMLGVLPVVVAAFAYPLGNRKMMEVCGGEFDTYQRVLGMTLASLPFWFVLGIYGLVRVGLPSCQQVNQSLIVALSSGVIATVLFFTATDLTKGDLHKLAAVESTQSGEIIFSLLGEIFVLNGKSPTPLSFAGIGLVILGMILHSFSSAETKDQAV
ncbi:multidrug resistance efflux transporter family protein [Desulfosporosinus sp. PR]|uniref:DMT family transporter n=1 Tax=Candidatus Desulfosporosinus nitrosoreducens TaxID=3401928 RepID=UPI0027FC4BAF|nr:multidrug resistance efflux transporter family protein [Desulfosporosinus sp. PR]MDQ7092414.1 multidrug resistance efflux transporter family protein [Desulfosporosinus sp. PR]